MSSSQRVVLIVDDDTEWCELMTLVLAESGHRGTVAMDLPAVTHLLSSVNPDVAIVDLLLPDQAGFLACHALRSAVGAHVRIILKLGYWDYGDLEDVKALRAAELVVMPFPVEEMVERV